MKAGSGKKLFFLLVSHNIDEGYRLCDELAVVVNGRLAGAGLKEAVFTAPPNILCARITGCKNIAMAHRVDRETIRVPAWGALLKTKSLFQEHTGFGAIRANHIRLADKTDVENVFLGQIVERIEEPFRITVFMKIVSPGCEGGSGFVQWEISREQWKIIEQMPQPLKVCFPLEQMLYLSEGVE